MDYDVGAVYMLIILIGLTLLYFDETLNKKIIYALESRLGM